MNRLLFLLLIFACSAIAPAYLPAQIISSNEDRFNPDSIRRDFKNQPYFGLYKDNYFIFGPPIGQKVTKENTNIKFQISIAQRLTNATLPWGTYLYLFYSQKCFWNVLENSMPMTDLNFNPGIGLTKPLFVKNRYVGKVSLIIEHESNGRDSIWSRSWNKVSLAANIIIDPNLSVAGKIWAPIIDGMNNKDILHYCGLYQISVQAMTDNRKFTGALTLVKRAGNFFNYNTILELAWRFSRKSNQYFFLQYYNGYGEGLLDYKVFKSQLRVGIVIKPQLFSDF
ncbi:MAG: phospholipase A [Muribaculaceae bacterium]|nr:phospholipase A [Muribaculaceae bacterium]MCI9054751.1 phospholipase A [Muribaculaceae bacterium]